MAEEQEFKMNELEERKLRRIRMKNYLKESRTMNVTYPSIINELAHNSFTDEEV